MKDTREWATIGKIVAPFGIHGELKVRLFTDIPNRFVTLDAIYVMGSRDQAGHMGSRNQAGYMGSRNQAGYMGSRNQAGYMGSRNQAGYSSSYVLYPIEGVRPYKGEMVLLKLRGIDEPNAAETLRDSDLCVPLSALPQLPPDSYYQHDIVGLQVFKLDGTLIGVIDDIMSTGGNDVYIINTPDRRQFLIPAIKDVVKQIDLIRHVMYIDPMRGLLDDDAVVDDQTEQEDE
jgi:16S rRNA processing protein RimM